MKPVKTLLVAGAVTAVLGGALMASVAVSLGEGAGTAVKIGVTDFIPAVGRGLQYEGGNSPGILGEPAPAAPAPAEPAPAAPAQ